MSVRKEQLLTTTYETLVNVAFMTGSMSELSGLVDRNFMAYGTAADEKIFGFKGLRFIIERQKSQMAGQEPKINRRIVSKTMLNDCNGALIVEEFEFQMKEDGSVISFTLRMSTLLEYKKSKWLIIHFHGSLPDINTIEGSAWPMEELKRRNIELEKSVNEKTADLQHKNRELEVEAAVERIRAIALAMHKSEEIHEVVRALRNELFGLKLEGIIGATICLKQPDGRIRLWDITDVKTTGRYGWDILFDMKEIDPRLWVKKIWKSKKQIITTEQDSNDLKRTLKWLAGYDKKTADRLIKLLKDNNIKHGWHRAVRLVNGILITDFINEPPGEIGPILLKIGAAFDLAHKRFLDLKNAEAQAREAQIEVSVERVRAKALAMHRSEEILGVVIAMHQELGSLKIPGVNAATITLRQDDETIRLWDITSAEEYKDGFRSSMDVRFRLKETHPRFYLNRIWRSKKKYFVIEQNERDFPITIEWVRQFDKPAADNLKKTIKVNKIKHSWHPGVQLEYGRLNVDSAFAPEAEMETILLKLGAAFDLAYKRFLDLQKAEAQAREAQIETALERVRSRSMAMHKTDELLDAAEVVHKELSALGINSMNVSYAFVSDDEKYGSYYSINPVNGRILPIPFVFPHTETKEMRSILTSWKKHEPINVIELNEKTTLKHQTYIGQHIQEQLAKNNIPFSVEEFLAISPKKAVLSTFNFSKGYLFNIGNERLTKTEEDLLLRFTRVFEQTYTRFLDLQKAEAQAREAQIEAALERVRARTMGMHKSEEFTQVIEKIYKEFLDLGLDAFAADLMIFTEDKKGYDIWVSRKDGTEGPYRTSGKILDHPHHIGTMKAWINGEKIRITELKGKLFSSYMKIVVGVSHFSSKKVGNGFLSFGRFFHTEVFTKHGCIRVATREKRSEEQIDIQKRFANVFDQTYTRFLDLQKAEAQVREANIEAGLERVRSRAMAMQSSEELNALIGTVFTELTKLDLALTRCVIWVFDPRTNSPRWWMANSEEPSNPMNFSIKYHEHPAFLTFVQEWKKQNVKFVYDLKGQDKVSWDDILFNETDLKHLPDVVKNGMRAPERVLLSCSFNNFGGINVASLEPLSDEHFDILLRFAKVFDLTYTRFNDLKQAEAQAREAEIELALERVRAKTMAMQKPSEFIDVINVIGDQFVHLGFDIDWVNFSANGLDISNGIDVWNFAVIPGHYRAAQLLNIPYIDHPLFTIAADGIDKYKRTGEDLFFIDLDEKDRESWMEYMYTNTIFREMPDEFKAIQKNKPGYTSSLVILKDSWLSIGKFDVKHFTEEQNAILRRFANAFGQAYTRFLDLQKAEAQAKESQIQLALERVRARTMAMQRSDELPQAANLLFQQIQLLGMPAWSAGYCIWDQDKKAITLSMSSEGVLQPTLRMPLTEDPSLMHFREAWERGESFWVEEVGGEALKQHYAYLRTLPGVKETLDDIEKAGFPVPTFQIFHLAYFSQGFLLFITYESVPESHDIFKRFGKVFDQTYTRFLDLQKAEAQARESQVQLALERVRARTMAMQKSDELPETSLLLFQQMKEFGETVVQNSIGIIKEEEGFVELSTTVHGHHEPKTLHVPINDPHVMAKAVAAWKAKRKSLTLEFKGQELKDYNELRNSFLETKVNFPEDNWVVNIVFFSKGWLSFSSNHEISKESFQLLERFAGVFDLTYTRFLDLKQAEAQTREAQIELGLERVRARAMAMQRSDELKELIATLSAELGKLDIILDRSFIIIYDTQTMGSTWWMANPETPSEPIGLFVKYHDHPSYLAHIDAWKKRKIKWEYILEADTKKTWDRFLFVETELSQLPAFVIDNMRSKEKVYLSSSFNNFGYLTLATLEPLTNEQFDIMLRFARVFDLTYTRFSDLKQAEAQAKEAKIEAALERVRSRTMAMHQTSELQEVIHTVHKELLNLDLSIDGGSFVVINKDVGPELRCWGAGGTADTSEEIYVPNFNMPFCTNLINGIKSGPGFLTEEFSQKEKIAYFTKLFEQKPWSELSDVQKKETLSGSGGYTRSVAVSKYTSIFIINHQGRKFTETENDILRRFAKVFEQTYTRFLDLQKAETQAREAQIELALERVRARTMAMHKSEELAEAAQVMFHQLNELGGAPDRISIGVADEAAGFVNFWTTDQAGSHINNSFKARLNERTVISKTYQGWKEHKKSLVIDLHGDDLKEWIKFAREEMSIVVKEENIHDRRVHNLAFFSHGWILVTTHERQSTETIQILERFASVFNLTYRRFLDLQKAEAQAREAQIELALERVRARTMAMHRSEELAETAEVLYHQLKELGDNPERITIGLLNESTGVITWWATDQQGSQLNFKFEATIDEPTVMLKLYNAWKAKNKSLVIDLTGNELSDWVKYCREVIGVPIKEELLKNRRVQTAGFFSHGWVMITSPHVSSPETIQILERFASVFNLTYRRFLDLQKAEAQAREAQIEAALERVRSRTMGMQRSGELKEAAQLLFQQVQTFGVDQWACGYNIWEPDGQTCMAWMSRQGILQPPFKTNFSADPCFKRFYEAKQRGETFYVEEMGGDEIKEHYKRLLSLPEFRSAPQEFFDEFIAPEFQIFHIVHFAQGYLMFITYEPVPQLWDIFERFGKVFEQTYTRFLDLQRAEAQAKEARIEISLERIRARALAMHKSEELKEVATVLWEQMALLGQAELEASVVHLYEKDPDNIHSWRTVSIGTDSNTNLTFGHMIIPKTSCEFVREWLTRFYSDLQEYTLELSGDKQNEWYEIMARLAPDVFNSMVWKQSIHEKRYYRFSKFSGGALLMVSKQEPSEEVTYLQRRAAVVFDLAYRRFADLQKAEAQAREAQIEAALERVRAKAMAMHKSDDLQAAVTIMFEEFQKLNLEVLRCGIGILDKDARRGTIWATSVSDNGFAVQISANESFEIHALMKLIYEHWQKQEDLAYVLQGQDLVDYYRAMDTSQLKLPKSQLLFSEGTLAVQYYYGAMFSAGGLYAFRDKPFIPEDIKIMKRFASVVDLTYKRFFDLQKTEAQAREAQIETGLERVRAKTMGMHSSEDVSTATATMFIELDKLGIQNLRGGITIVRPDQTQEVWSVTNLPDGRTIRAIGVFDMRLHPLWRALFEGKTKNEDYQYYWLAGKEKENYIEILNATPSYLAQPIKDFPDVHVQSYFFGEGAIWTNSLQPHSDENKQIMKRFASVFSLTFRRYQDLQKAEAQAREATIEAALEKVRGKAMAMHNSNDLSATATIIFTELRKLGITPIRCGVGLLNKGSRRGQLYSAGDNLSLIGWVELADHPVLEKIYDTWLNNEEYYPELEGEQKLLYYQQLLKGLAVTAPDTRSATKQYGHFIPFSIGCLYAWADKRYDEAEIKILRRFASIIDLTFRRYMELQKSEANAREAVKQAALDRVRADIASMRTVEDLDRITPLIWNELTTLNIPFIRCGVFIMDDSQQFIHTFLSTPDGKAIAAFHLPYDTPGNISKVIDNWRHKKRYVDHWDEEEFIQFAEILMKQGALTSKEQYLKTIPRGGFYLHFLPFLQGMLYVGNTVQLNDEQIELIQHVADAFSTAYARYEDFNRLEAAKKQVENTLTDLKQAQTQLVQSEKMASLGELTAGIAHEIQNPLNFVNNFSDVSNELLEEMKHELATGNTQQAIDIANDVIDNLDKILHHGKRADAIVKGMLQHSRTSSGQKEMTDINILADEYLRLAYHGLRAKDKTFNAKFETHFDNNIGKVNVIPQDIGRVILNLINNAFYTVTEKKKQTENGYEPTVKVTTVKDNGRIEIKVQDNGNGIPQKNLDKIFQPFFTTKPTGQGTGLGLSLAYDIVTKGHGGELKVETKEGEGSEFVIQLPG